MNKKGFTLMEILGSIIIISIIGVLAVVTFTRNMKGFREDYYVETVRTLTESGKEFFNDNKKYRPSDVLTSQVLPINTLVTQKYIDEVHDYKGNSCSNSSYVIVIKNGKDDYTYHACLVCPEDDYSNMSDKYCDEAWRTSTSIEYTIATPPELFVYLGTPKSSLRELLAIKASYVKKNSKGEVIGVVDGTGFDDTPTIYPENFDTVDTNKIGVYPINYEYQGKTTTGHVTVYKFEEPNFSIKKQETYATDLQGHTTTSLKEMYISGTWTQKIFITLSAGESTAESMPNVVNRYQWNKDGVWQDICLGSSCNDKEIAIEMNENIKFRSISVDNRISDETAITNIKIDNTKPACTLNKSGQQKTSDWYTSDVTLTFNRKEDLVRTSTEAVSGIKYYNITVSTGSLAHSASPSTVHNYDSKGVTYIGYVEDQARNFITCDISFRRDATNPTCSLKTIGERETPTNPWYFSSNVVITFNAKADLDDKGTTTNSSGIKITKITGNGNEHATSITDPADTGGVTYTGYVEDNAGNSVTCTTYYKKDSTKPECSITSSGPQKTSDWYTGNVTISFTSATDNLSQVRSHGIETYSGNGESKIHSSDTAGITYTGYIIDNAGNTNSCTTSFRRDATDPVCTLKTTGTRENASNPWYNSESVAIAFDTFYDLDDQGTAVNASYVKTTKITGNGNEHANSIVDSADTDGVTYTGYVEDYAGNSTTCTISYKKDSTKPECSLTTSGTMGDNGWYKSPSVTVSFSSTSDATSDVENYGIASVTGSKTATHTQNTTGVTYTGHIRDNAGNTNTCSVTFKKDDASNMGGCSISQKNNWTSEDGYNITTTLGSKPISGCAEDIGGKYSSTTSSCVNDYGQPVPPYAAVDTVSHSVTFTSNSGVSYTCSGDASVKIDNIPPSCGNVSYGSDSLSGVSVSVGCDDSDSQCSSSTFGGTYTLSGDITIKDNAGNSDTCSYTVSSYQVHSDRTWNKCVSGGDCIPGTDYYYRCATASPGNNCSWVSSNTTTCNSMYGEDYWKCSYTNPCKDKTPCVEGWNNWSGYKSGTCPQNNTGTYQCVGKTMYHGG